MVEVDWLAGSEMVLQAVHGEDDFLVASFKNTRREVLNLFGQRFRECIWR